MQIIRVNTSEGYTSHGQAVTPGNSGGASGDAWVLVDDALGVGAITANSTNPGRGTYSTRIDTGSTVPVYVGWDGLTFTPDQNAFIGCLVRRNAYPTSSVYYKRAIAGNQTAGRVSIDSLGAIHLWDNNNAEQWASPNGAFPLSSFVRSELRTKLNSASGGELQLRLWTTDPTSTGAPDYDSGLIPVNTTDTLIACRFGSLGNNNSAQTYFDDFVVADDWPGYLGNAPGFLTKIRKNISAKVG